MSNIRLVHVDGAPEIRLIVAQICAQLPDVTYVGGYADADEALEVIAETKPDIALLDIEMPGKGGFELAAALHSLPTDIIYLTRHEHFALDAFDTMAAGYLLKPPTVAAMKRVLERWRQRRVRPAGRDEAGAYTPEFLPAGQGPLRRLWLPMVNSALLIQLSDLVLIEAKSNYSIFSMVGGQQHTTAQTLKVFAAMLDGHPDFLRVNRSCIINKNFVASLTRHRNKNPVVRMANGREVELTSLRKGDLINQIAR